jgi:hypothetical protein
LRRLDSTRLRGVLRSDSGDGAGPDIGHDLIWWLLAGWILGSILVAIYIYAATS